MKIRRLTQALTFPAALAILLTTGTSTQAHYVYYAQQAWSNSDSSLCLWNYAETSHGSNGGGYFKGEARSQADVDLNPFDCILPWERNQGDLGEFLIIYKWYVNSQGDGSWLQCEKPDDWHFNSEPATTFVLWGRAPAEPLCGAGWYGIHNIAVMRDGGVWVGKESVNWSGQHLLPDTSRVSTVRGAAPAAPKWATEKGLNKMPSKVAQVGRDGKLITDRNGNQVMVDTAPPELDEKNAAAGGKRTTTTDEYGNVTETVFIDF
ncbi:hypothetical protein [Streptomyces sp. CAI 127]|uniref:hypothetical protein n=1 Tax=Streptomyces sp. CAI 127 TaxID=1076397 RepID=UPI001587450B|nr:hypothetical protein [Streptomyces sp. CAI 127]NUW04033.1 hypothetical protein [Streptomyces sp. CAI 127]